MHRHDKSWRLAIISKRTAQFLHTDSWRDITHCRLGPDRIKQRLLRHQLIGVFQ